MIKNWKRIYYDRRDRYGVTYLTKKRAFRIFTKDETNPINTLIEKGLLEDLSQRKIFQPFSIRKFNKYHFSLLIQKKITPAIMPSEWSVLMHIDAARLILKTEEHLQDSGFTLDDVHLWNILFDGPKPYLIDMGAINVTDTDLHWKNSSEDRWAAYSSFKAAAINSIFLFAGNKHFYVRKMMQDYYAFSNLETLLMLIRSPLILMIYIMNAVFVLGLKVLRFITFSKLCNKIYFKGEKWFLKTLASYVTKKISLDDQSELNSDFKRAISSFLESSKRSSVVLHTNSLNLFNFVQSQTHSKLALISNSENMLDAVYLQKYTNTSVGLIDLRSPTPGTGPLNSWVLPALERISGEIGIFQLDINDLVYERCMTVNEVFFTVDKMFTSRAVFFFDHSSNNLRLQARDYGQFNNQSVLDLLNEVFNNVTQVLALEYFSIYTVTKKEKNII